MERSDSVVARSGALVVERCGAAGGKPRETHFPRQHAGDPRRCHWLV